MDERSAESLELCPRYLPTRPREVKVVVRTGEGHMKDPQPTYMRGAILVDGGDLWDEVDA